MNCHVIDIDCFVYIDEWKRIAAKLAMSGKEDNAIQKLEEEIQKAQQNGKLHEAYELEMLLVEMYIYKVIQN